MRGRLGGRFVLAAAIAVMALLGYFGGSSQNEIGRKTPPISLTPEEELALGTRLTDQLGGEVVHPLAEYVTQVGERVAEHASLEDCEFHVLADPVTVNAFALPGGQVFVTLAMLRELESEAELAGILGHLVGHVAGRHGAEQLTNHELVSLRYSRSEEIESDALAVRLMSAAGYDPHAMVGAMKALHRAPRFVQTHPKPENRIERLRERVRSYQAAPGGGVLGEERYRDRVLVPLGETRPVSGRE